MEAPHEIGDIKEILGHGEKIMAQTTQRRWGPGGDIITPVTLIATDNKLIVVNRTKMGMKKDYEIVQYANIVSAKLIHGFLSSSIIIRVRGYKISPTEEISGFITREAKELIDYINRKIGSAPSATGQATPLQSAASAPQAPQTNHIGVAKRSDLELVFCPSCGGKNLAGAKFCSSCGKQIMIAK